MKNGVVCALSFLGVSMRLWGMEPAVDNAGLCVSLPGSVGQDVGLCVLDQKRLDLLVADCVSALIKAQVEHDLFYAGSDSHVHQLFVQKNIDPKAVFGEKYNPKFPVCSDERVLGMEYEDGQESQLEARLLQLIEQGGSFAQMSPALCSWRQDGCARTMGEPLDPVAFLARKLPEWLGNRLHSETVARLLAQDQNLHDALCISKPALGCQALRQAVGQDVIGRVRVLLDAGIDPLTPLGPLPETPYHYAAWRARPAILKLFLTSFAGNSEKINMQTMQTKKKPARTALDCALEGEGNQFVDQHALAQSIELLRSAGCKTAAQLAAVSEAERSALFAQSKPVDAAESPHAAGAQPEVPRTDSDKKVRFDQEVSVRKSSPQNSEESASSSSDASAAHEPESQTPCGDTALSCAKERPVVHEPEKAVAVQAAAEPSSSVLGWLKKVEIQEPAAGESAEQSGGALSAQSVPLGTLPEVSVPPVAADDHPAPAAPGLTAPAPVAAPSSSPEAAQEGFWHKVRTRCCCS